MKAANDNLTYFQPLVQNRMTFSQLPTGLIELDNRRTVLVFRYICANSGFHRFSAIILFFPPEIRRTRKRRSALFWGDFVYVPAARRLLPRNCLHGARTRTGSEAPRFLPFSSFSLSFCYTGSSCLAVSGWEHVNILCILSYPKSADSTPPSIQRHLAGGSHPSP